MKPIITVITIVYNGQECIKKTINSVLTQKDINIEYIIINGNSSDKTIDILNEYREKISLIISEKDNGLYDAMNKGIQHATGDYIVFMNCDDTFYNEHTLVNVVNSITKNNYPDILYGDSTEETNSGDILYKKARSHKYAWYGMFAHHQAIFYKNKTIKEYKINYNLDYTIGADYGFTLEVMKVSSQIIYVESPLCVFKQDGISSKHFYKGLRDQFLIRKQILNYSLFKCVVLYMLHSTSKSIREYFPFVWNLARFKRKDEL